MSTLKRYNGTDWEYVGGASTTDRFFYHIGDAPSNFDDAKTYGTYRVAGTYTNAPLSTTIYGILIVYESRGKTWIPSDSSSWIWQEFRDTSGRIWRRYGVNTSTYTSWEFVKNDSNYSTSEQRIGTWINGKPLYRKIVSGTMGSNETTKSVALGTSNVSLYTSCCARVIRNKSFNDSSNICEYYYGSQDYFNCFMNPPNNNSVAVRGGNDWPKRPYDFVVIVEYTKTTD